MPIDVVHRTTNISPGLPRKCYETIQDFAPTTASPESLSNLGIPSNSWSWGRMLKTLKQEKKNLVFTIALLKPHFNWFQDFITVIVRIKLWSHWGIRKTNISLLFLWYCIHYFYEWLSFILKRNKLSQNLIYMVCSDLFNFWIHHTHDWTNWTPVILLFIMLIGLHSVPLQ